MIFHLKEDEMNRRNLSQSVDNTRKPDSLNVIHGQTFSQWRVQLPILDDIINGHPLLWENPLCRPPDIAIAALQQQDIGYEQIRDAAARLQRFRPYIQSAFPSTSDMQGLIESPLRAIPAMKAQLEELHGGNIPGQLLLKCDSHLPISGSIKARGGIYEVLKLAETIALRHDLIPPDRDYGCLHSPEARTLFHEYRIAVGSTGNLGLAIGIIGSQLGFQVTVHMSNDARSWKKALLRDYGVEVVEHGGDYSSAVAKGRKESACDPRCHFVDDENSTDLFYGYAVAALRLSEQLEDAGILVDQDHPLFVYIPCGVGGGPGGISFGLKHMFGPHVRCFFVEPTGAPSVLLGLATGLHNRVTLPDFGIKLQTEADGLAVASPSGFVCRVMESLLDGIVTVDDKTMLCHLALLKDSENIDMEPSSLAAMSGPLRMAATSPATATHLVWGTGGSMVPVAEQHGYYQLGKMIRSKITGFPEQPG